MSKNTELWLPLPGFEGHYSISNMGAVRRDAPGPGTQPGRLLKQRPERRGYLTVSPVCPGVKQVPMLVHRLVLRAFVGEPAPGQVANHKNGIKPDNRLENLEWCTYSENIAHAYENGLHKRYQGSQASSAKLTEAHVTQILELVANRVYKKDIAVRFGISQRTISDIICGDHWQHVPRPANLSNRRTGRHVLTEQQVREIKHLLRQGTMSHGQIAAQFGVSGPTVWHIAAGRTWQHVV